MGSFFCFFGTVAVVVAVTDLDDDFCAFITTQKLPVVQQGEPEEPDVVCGKTTFLSFYFLRLEWSTNSALLYLR